MTAEVVLSGPRRDHVVRIPNSALSFRPPSQVLTAIGEHEPAIAHGAGQRVREVWEYDGTPIEVHAGLADGGWTELVSGNVRAGDALVTSAAVRPRSW
jgi:HlyD family secretion protein